MPNIIKHVISDDTRTVCLKGEGRPIKEYRIPILAAHRGGASREDFVELFLKQKYVDEFGEYVKPKEIIGNHGIGMEGNASDLSKSEDKMDIPDKAPVKAPKRRKKKAKSLQGVVEGSSYNAPEASPDTKVTLDTTDELKY
jgi:hypothetical protein